MSGPFDDLAEALIAAHHQPDILTTKLLFDDHETPASIDVGYVTKALKVTEQLDDTFVVRDFTRVATGKLEARDSHIRRQPTNFGVFVAECVRLHANAEVAIINSGAFRCDSELDPKLHVRDLREAFLYDTDDAMIDTFSQFAICARLAVIMGPALMFCWFTTGAGLRRQAQSDGQGFAAFGHVTSGTKLIREIGALKTQGPPGSSAGELIASPVQILGARRV
jgi:hypothetical protein